MEPERKDTRDTRETNTYIERKERSGGTAMGFIVGGLVVAVAIIALVFWGGDFIGDGGADIEISTQDKVPDVAPVENNVEINTGASESSAPAPAETAPATEAQPVAPANN